MQTEVAMPVVLHRMKETEDRVQIMLGSALNSAVVLGIILLLIILFGVVVAVR